ncbi:hypothetical protein Pmani_016355 [Petrolisthes manimaculis]|uniref:Uncharacterized protein n=1 Tax=Petrolisthes manimaculis TaxID=1843537 RepID=A0AAE1PSG4_9EUCA|nr:hypothetical protein Pmani_016355 [Petrolisthes manimaculis]
MIKLAKEIELEGEELKEYILMRDKEQREERVKMSDQRNLEIEAEKVKQEVELKRLQLEAQKAAAENRSFSANAIETICKPAFPKLPVFNESQDSIDAYLLRFESLATSAKWCKDVWAISLASLLQGNDTRPVSRVFYVCGRSNHTAKDCFHRYGAKRKDRKTESAKAAAVTANEKLIVAEGTVEGKNVNVLRDQEKMLKLMCLEQPKEWPLLFAYREVPQSSTTFSPFELIYGHSVRGPLSLLREAWEDDEGEEADGEDSSSWKEQMDECVEREQANVAIACEEDDFEDACIPVIPNFNKKETSNDVKVNENLSVKQKVDIEELTQHFEHLFSDVPGQSNVLQHNIKLKDERPVKKLTKKSSFNKIVWEPKHQDAFDNLKLQC